MSSVPSDSSFRRVRRPSPAAYPWAVSLHRSPKPQLAEAAGLVISPRQVLTCRHVVDRATGDGDAMGRPNSRDGNAPEGEVAPDAAGTRWWVICHQHRPNYATIAVARIVLPLDDSMADLALLELVADVPEGISSAPVALVNPHDLVSEGWWAFGHPGGDPFGNTARGGVGDALAHGYLRLDVDGGDGEEIAAGFSGAALWSPTHRAVVAVVTQHGPGGGGRAVTLDQVTAHLPSAVFLKRSLPKGQDSASIATVPRYARQRSGGQQVLQMGTVLGSMPIRPTPWIDRPAPIAAIREALDFGGETTRVVCLVGPGGSGKSQLAGEYARQLAHDRQAIIAWVGAETSSGLREGYGEVGRRLGVSGEDSTAVARRTVAYLAGISTPLLLVLDNAESLGVIEPYLPLGDGRCWVLITTRDRDVPFMDVGHVIDVPGLDSETAVDFLVEQTGLTPETAGQVALSLDRLPLALTAAVDTIRGLVSVNQGVHMDATGLVSWGLVGENKDPVSAGLNEGGVQAPLRTTPRTVRDNEPPLNSVDVVLANAVATARVRVAGASDVLNALAVLSPDGSSPELLARVLRPVPPVDFTVQILAAAGLVMTSSDKLLTIHRRTAAVIRALDPIEVSHARANVANQLDKLVNHREAKPRLTELDHEIVRHVGELIDAINPSASMEVTSRVVNAAHSLMQLLRSAGEGRIQVSLGENLARRVEEVRGPEHADTCTARSDLAAGYRAVGRYSEALDLDGRTLAARERILGLDHPETLTSRSNLALGYHAMGRGSDAVALDEMTLAARERLLGPDHPDTLISRNNLGAGLKSVNKIEKAVALWELTLAVRERVLGLEHPETLTSRSNLAGGYHALDRNREAVVLDEETLRVRERVLGPEHPRTLASKNNLAGGYHDLDRDSEAVELWRATLEVRERVLGLDHPDTLTSRSNLAGGLRALGRNEDAVALDEVTLKTRERVLGPDHPDTAASRQNLSLGYEALGRIAMDRHRSQGNSSLGSLDELP